MIRSLLGLLFILIGISLLATGMNGDSSVIESESSRHYGTYAGAALLALGFIVGKFWSLKWQPKRRTNAGNSVGEPLARTPEFAGVAAKREEPVEEQIDLFEPRNKI